MLYISRRYGKNKWGVTDTDDYVETQCTYMEIKQYVLEMGLEIKGVTTHESLTRVPDGSALVAGLDIQHIEVYQNAAFLTSKQAKAATLLGVDIKVSGKDIVQISVPNDLPKNTVKVRLSDYGETCSSHILGTIRLTRGKTLVIVIDDKIKVTTRTFHAISDHYGVVLDITEVTNLKIVERIYNTDTVQRAFDSFTVFIEDIPERKEFYKGVGILRCGLDRSSSSLGAKGLLKDADKVCQQLIKRYDKEFRDLVDAPLVLKNVLPDYVINIFAQRQSVRWILEKYALGMLDFNLVKTQAEDVLYVLRECSKIDRASLNRFENFIKYFDVPTEYRQLYMRLCVKGVCWLKEESEKRKDK